MEAEHAQELATQNARIMELTGTVTLLEKKLEDASKDKAAVAAELEELQKKKVTQVTGELMRSVSPVEGNNLEQMSYEVVEQKKVKNFDPELMSRKKIRDQDAKIKKLSVTVAQLQGKLAKAEKTGKSEEILKSSEGKVQKNVQALKEEVARLNLCLDERSREVMRVAGEVDTYKNLLEKERKESKEITGQMRELKQMLEVSQGGGSAYAKRLVMSKLEEMEESYLKVRKAKALVFGEDGLMEED